MISGTSNGITAGFVTPRQARLNIVLVIGLVLWSFVNGEVGGSDEVMISVQGLTFFIPVTNTTAFAVFRRIALAITVAYGFFNSLASFMTGWYLRPLLSIPSVKVQARLSSYHVCPYRWSHHCLAG